MYSVALNIYMGALWFKQFHGREPEEYELEELEATAEEIDY